MSDVVPSLTDRLVREIGDRPVGSEWPVNKASATYLLLSATLRSKSWRCIAEGHGEFAADRLRDRWDASTGRTYQLTRIRIDPSTDNYAAFYELETTRCA